MRRDYLRDPQAIYRESFARILAEADLSDIPADARGIATRIVHACGMPEIAADLRFNGDVAGAVRTALRAGAPILVDARMVAAGIMARRLPAANEILCMPENGDTAAAARERETTRSAAGVVLCRDRLDGAVVAIGNAPTALFQLLELLANGAPRPAAVLAFPVGFVGAAESKADLVAEAGTLPYATCLGRRGGSPFAAAALNACLVDAGA
jgi:precorrin-8X/cobalt-precorrin-8 methylmutase